MYQLDKQAACEAEQVSNYLTDTGKYKGEFIRAEKLVSKAKGTHGVGFTFKSKDNRTTRFDIWTTKADGDQLMGYKALMAIMACMRVSSMKPVKAMIERYNWDTKTTDNVEAEVFKELMNKPIGLLLRNTQYEKMENGAKTGELGWRLEFYIAFDAESEMTAGELIGKKTTSEALPAIIATLADKPLKNQPKAAQSSANDYYPDIGLDPIDF